MSKIRIAYMAAIVAAVLSPAFASAQITDSLAFDKAIATSPAEFLRGRVSGVQVHSLDGGVNGALSTHIRGVNSLRAGSHPLWIIDGVMVNSSLDSNRDAFFQYGEQSFPASLNALAYLNAYDIESIEVLKDVSATALYGVRGADGVIIVNTLKPIKEGLDFTWNSDLGYFTGSDGLSHRHSFSLTNSIRQTRYMVSGFYRDQEGSLTGDNSNYAGVRAIFDTRSNKTLWFGMNFAAAFGKMSTAPGTAYFGMPSLTLARRDATLFPNDTKEAWEKDYDDDVEERRLTNSVWLAINFTRQLTLKTTVGVDFHSNNRYLWYGNMLSFGAANNGAAALASSMMFRFNANSELNWKGFIGKDHKIEAAAGVETVGEFTSNSVMNGTDFFSHELRAKGLSLAGSRPVLHKYNHDHNNFGFYGRFDYAFRDIAGIDGVLRADKTPRYDDSFNIYGGVNAWVDVHNALLKDFKPVSSLRIKGGFGEAGREQYVPYGLYGDYVGGGYTPVAADIQLFYEALSRVRSIEYTAGIEAGFLNDRIRFAATWFDKLTADTFTSWCFGKDGGRYWRYAPRREDFRNASLIGNRGLEFDLSADILKTKDLSLSVYGNATLASNQVLRVDEGDAAGHAIGQGLRSNINVVGYQVGAIYGFLEDENGAYIDVTGDGRLDDYDKDIIGNPLPKFYGGFGFNLRWRDLTLDVMADGAAGFDILNLNALMQEGSAPYDISESYIEKGDYLKLRRVSLGYNVPVKGIRFIKGLAVRASAYNLLTSTHYSGYDPEVDCFGSSPMSAGLDYGSFPASRRFILGVSVKF